MLAWVIEGELLITKVVTVMKYIVQCFQISLYRKQQIQLIRWMNLMSYWDVYLFDYEQNTVYPDHPTVEVTNSDHAVEVLMPHYSSDSEQNALFSDCPVVEVADPDHSILEWKFL